MDTQQFIKLLQSSGRVSGPGTGTSDSVPAIIKKKDGGEIPAALSEGEFVIRADVVSALGGGATDPGVQVLDFLQQSVLKMDREKAALLGGVIRDACEMLTAMPKKKETNA